MAYTDLTNEFFTRRLIEWESLDELAENDKDNLLAAGTKALFVQASAPLGWTKDTGVNARALRVVSGSSGGTTGGGSQDIGSAISLAHDHDIDSHNHSLTAHSHVLDFTTGSISATADISARILSPNSAGSAMALNSGSATANTRAHTYETASDGTGTSGDADGTLDSAMDDITFKYMNAIVCTKD